MQRYSILVVLLYFGLVIASSEDPGTMQPVVEDPIKLDDLLASLFSSSASHTQFTVVSTPLLSWHPDDTSTKVSSFHRLKCT